MGDTPDTITRLVSNLDGHVWEAQQSLLYQGKKLVANWLEKADREGGFNEAVDWLTGNGADRYFNSNRHILAVELIRNVVKDLAIDADNPTEVYQSVRNWFGTEELSIYSPKAM